MTDTGNYPFRQARDFYKGRRSRIRLIVLHATVTAETSKVAEAIQNTWTTDDGRLASAHLIADDDSTVRSVHDTDTAWAAKGANADGLHLEIVGRADQTATQWADPFSRRAVARAARAGAEWAREYDIPVRRLTVTQVRDGATRGFTDHATIEKAFPSTGHSDPGPNFPWQEYLRQVSTLLHPTNPLQEDDVSPEDRKAIVDDVVAQVKELLLLEAQFLAGRKNGTFNPEVLQVPTPKANS